MLTKKGKLIISQDAEDEEQPMVEDHKKKKIVKE